MQAKGNARPRRRPVARHPGIYYRPRPDGRVQPPYEVPYLDSSGKRRWAIVHGSLDDAEAKLAQTSNASIRAERIVGGSCSTWCSYQSVNASRPQSRRL